MRRLLALAAGALVVAAPAAHAATIPVDTTADTFAGDGQCSLREAVSSANADAIAAKAAELGGKVVVPPFDAPWVRMTILTDPQGATFIASQFVLENRDVGSSADSAVGAA